VQKKLNPAIKKQTKSSLPKGKCLIVIRQRVRNWARGNGQNTVPFELTIIFCESCGRRKPALSAVLYRNVSGYLKTFSEKLFAEINFTKQMLRAFESR